MTRLCPHCKLGACREALSKRDLRLRTCDNVACGKTFLVAENKPRRRSADWCSVLEGFDPYRTPDQGTPDRNR